MNKTILYGSLICKNPKHHRVIKKEDYISIDNDLSEIDFISKFDSSINLTICFPLCIIIVCAILFLIFILYGGIR